MPSLSPYLLELMTNDHVPLNLRIMGPTVILVDMVVAGVAHNNIGRRDTPMGLGTTPSHSFVPKPQRLMVPRFRVTT